MSNKQNEIDNMLKWSNDILERIRSEGGDPEILIEALAKRDITTLDDAFKKLLDSGVTHDTINELLEFMEHVAEMEGHQQKKTERLQVRGGNDVKSKPGDVFVVPKSARLDASSKPELLVDSDVRCNIFTFDTKFVN